MNGAEGGLVADIVRHLELNGFVLVPRTEGDGYQVLANDRFELPHRPVLTVSEGMLGEYLEGMSSGLGYAQDRSAEALSLTKIHLVEELATDHGDGRNHVRALGYRRRKGGVEFFVDQDLPDPRALPEPAADLEWRADRPSE